MKLDVEQMRRLVEVARVARLATIDQRLRPQVVPIVLAVEGNVFYSGSDEQVPLPQRYRDVQRHPDATLLIDEYDEHWSSVWWVRLCGRGRVVVGDDERQAALQLLSQNYPQYGGEASRGPVLAVDVEEWSGWAFSDDRQETEP